MRIKNQCEKTAIQTEEPTKNLKLIKRDADRLPVIKKNNDIQMKRTNKELHSIDNEYLHEAKEISQKRNSTFFMVLKRYSTFFLLLTGALIVLFLFLWKDYEDKKQMDSIIQNATNQLDATNQELLKLMAKPLVWSIRADMLRGNPEQIDKLMLDLVKEKNVQFIHLIGLDGNVLLSTNKGFEGKMIGNNVDAALLLVRSEMVVVQINQVFFVSAPIFGIDKHIATLIIAYKPPVPVFGNKIITN